MAKKIKSNKVKRFVNEPVAYAEVGTFLHRMGDGRAKVKSYTSVNEPLRVMAAEDTKQVLRLRVETHVKECKDVQDDGSFYEKDVKVKQIREDFDTEETTETPGSSYTQPSHATSQGVPDGTVRPGMDKADYLKNFLDKLFDKTRDLYTMIIVFGVIAVVALVLAVVL